MDSPKPSPDVPSFPKPSLLALDRELADYVIVHEMLHFYVPNHGKLWKSLMRAHLGDYERAESKLRAKAWAHGRTRE
jgi:predicted metal-dependent hydrolase